MRFLNDVGFPYACDLLGVYRDAEHTYALSSEHVGGGGLAWRKFLEVVTTFATEGDLFSWCEAGVEPQGRKAGKETTCGWAFRVACLRATRGKSRLASVPASFGSFAWRRMAAFFRSFSPLRDSSWRGFSSFTTLGSRGPSSHVDIWCIRPEGPVSRCTVTSPLRMCSCQKQMAWTSDARLCSDFRL